MHLEPGRVLHWNLHVGGHLSTSVPVRVVEHTADGLLLWLNRGTPMWRAALPGGAHLRDVPPEERPEAGYPFRTGRWTQGHALIHQPAGAAHAVLWRFAPGLVPRSRPRFRGWYVNLEHRNRHGDTVDVADHELDLLVAPDRTWRWKDEESFHRMTGHPAHWTAEEAEAIRAEGERVARLAEAGAFPFDGTWCDFVPPRSWTAPSLPPRPAPTVQNARRTGMKDGEAG